MIDAWLEPDEDIDVDDITVECDICQDSITVYDECYKVDDYICCEKCKNELFDEAVKDELYDKEKTNEECDCCGKKINVYKTHYYDEPENLCIDCVKDFFTFNIEELKDHKFEAIETADVFCERRDNGWY